MSVKLQISRNEADLFRKQYFLHHPPGSRSQKFSIPTKKKKHKTTINKTNHLC